MKRINYILLIILPSAFFSCIRAPSNLFDTQEKKQRLAEPVYTPDIVWTLDTNVYPSVDEPIQYDRYLYATESNWASVSTIDENEYDVVKIDLESGKIVYRTQVVSGSDNSSVVKFGKYVCVGKYYGGLYVFDDENNGALLATVEFGSTNEEKHLNNIYYSTMIECNGDLFWSTCTEGKIKCNGLVKLCFNKINFSLPPNEVQVVVPEMLWQNKDTDTCIHITPVAENGIIYFQTYDRRQEQQIKTVAIYANSGKIKWSKDTNVLNGNSRKAMYIIGNKLYIIADIIGCYEKNNGNIIYEINQTYEDLQKEVSLGASCCSSGASYSEGKFYFTNTASWSTPSVTGIPKSLVRNIICMDAKTGKYVWGDFPEGSGSLASRPIVENGKVFVTCREDYGLRVYDAEKGTLIGVDHSVYTFGHSANAQYGGLVMYFNLHPETRTSTLTAIRP